MPRHMFKSEREGEADKALERRSANARKQEGKTGGSAHKSSGRQSERAIANKASSNGAQKTGQEGVQGRKDERETMDRTRSAGGEEATAVLRLSKNREHTYIHTYVQKRTVAPKFLGCKNVQVIRRNLQLSFLLFFNSCLSHALKIRNKSYFVL